jgi:hypothetical protein
MFQNRDRFIETNREVEDKNESHPQAGSGRFFSKLVCVYSKRKMCRGYCFIQKPRLWFPSGLFFFFFPLLADYLEEAGSSANKRLPTADSLAAWSSYVDILFDVVSKYGAASS